MEDMNTRYYTLGIDFISRCHELVIYKTFAIFVAISTNKKCFQTSLTAKFIKLEF